MMTMRAIAGLLAASLLAGGAVSAPRKAAPAQTGVPAGARNVIIFLGDAGGLPTLSAAGIPAHGRLQSPFIQSMPHIGLSDISSLDRWVTDPAETAKPGATIAHNAVISVDDGHTGEDVLDTAYGPGANRVRGFFANTHLFGVLMNAMDWQEP